MAYSELIKNFEKIREYMRSFYVYGFKSRNGYTQKSARSYDDERRRIESWLSNNMRFVMTPEGKNVFISIDVRAYKHNPLYKAWKAKSFTDSDITLHFIIFDILFLCDTKLSLNELLEQIDEYLCGTEISFDESTIRKKLKEYIELGIVSVQKDGKRLLYSRTPDTDISSLTDIIDFFSEGAPLGIVGSYLLDKLPEHEDIFSFKHHYITETMDSGVLALLFDAMSDKCFVSAVNSSLRNKDGDVMKFLPLRVLISVQSGRQNLIAYDEKRRKFISLRLDRLSNVKKEEHCPHFDALRERLSQSECHMWGVNCKISTENLEHIEFDVFVGDEEKHIINRLEREKRCGTVEMLDEHNYRFSADVFDANEMIPWIRTFICRITRLECSNKDVESTFKNDLYEMYLLYGMDGGDENDIQ